MRDYEKLIQNFKYEYLKFYLSRKAYIYIKILLPISLFAKIYFKAFNLNGEFPRNNTAKLSLLLLIYRFESQHRFLNCVINKISNEGDFRGGQRGRNCNFIRATSLNLIKLSQFSPHYRNSCEIFSFKLCTLYTINAILVLIIYVKRSEFCKFIMSIVILFPIYFCVSVLLFLLRTKRFIISRKITTVLRNRSSTSHSLQTREKITLVL